MAADNDDIETTVRKVVAEYWRLRATGLSVEIEPAKLEQFSLLESGEVGDRPMYRVKTEQGGLTGAHRIVVYNSDVWEGIRSRFSNTRHAHCIEFEQLSNDHPALTPLVEKLAFLYEALQFFGFNTDLRQIGDHGKPAEWRGKENAALLFFSPAHYQDIRIHDPSEAVSFSVARYCDGLKIKPDFQNPNLSPESQQIGPFSEFLHRHAPESPHRLIGEIWQGIVYCIEAVRSRRYDDAIANAIHIGVGVERLSWKLKHEAAAMVTYNQKAGRELGGITRAKQQRAELQTTERLSLMVELIEKKKFGVANAAHIVSKQIGGTEGGNKKLWYRRKKPGHS